MKASDLRRLAPLLIVLGVVLYREFFDGSNEDAGADTPRGVNTSVLGTRTMSAIKDFVERLAPIARQVEAETGISSVLGMAEASEESAYGASQLTLKANNLFGFTAEPGTYWRSQNLSYVEMPTHEWVKQQDGSTNRVEVTRPFRAYPSWEASYRDWARLMATPHYVNAGALAALKAGDAAAFGAALNRAGYATDPNYGQKVAGRVGIIQEAIA